MSNELSVEDFHNPSHLPVIQTADVQRFIDSFNAWLHPDNRQPFIVIGPEGCGKGLVANDPDPASRQNYSLDRP